MPDPAVMKGVLRHLRRTERRRLYDLLADPELLARFLDDRDEAAFEELVCRHGPMVRAVCRRVLGPTADADDAFQAAFLVLLRKARSIRRTDLLANWLCAVAYRTARQALRRRYRRGARERTGDDLPEPSRPDDPPRDWLPLFDAALQRLPAKYREPVVLCELQGLSRPEAARHLGLNEGTLSSRLGRGRDLLRRKLSPYGFPLAIGTALAPAVVPEALTASTAAAAVSVSAASVSATVLTEGVLTAMFASKLKAGAACTAVLLVGAVTGFQFTGPASLAGGPPGKDFSSAKEAAKPGPTADPKPARLAAEYEPFQGKWDVTAAGRDGSATTPGGVGVDETWKFSGNVLTTGGEAKDDAGATFTLDPRTTPAAIDFTLTKFNPDGTGTLIRTDCQGIYRFDPDGRLQICFRPKAGAALRPTRFVTAHNSGATVIGLRRPEPPKREAPLALDAGVPAAAADRLFPIKTVDSGTVPHADLAQVIGKWELTNVDGETPEAAAEKQNKRAADRLPEGAIASRDPQRWEVMRRLYLLPGGGPSTLSYRTVVTLCLASVELDATKSPKWITLHATEQRPGDDSPRGIPPAKPVRLCGIYKLDGDRLVMCVPEGEVSPLLRPTEFKGDDEGGLYVLTYKRPAKPWTAEPKLAPPAVDPRFDLPAREPPVVGPPTENPVGPLPIPSPQLPLPDVSSLPPPSIPMAGDLMPLPTATVPPPPAPSTDLDRLQGAWVPVQVDGKPLGTDEMSSIEILKDRLLGSDGKHGRIRLDEAKSPKRVSFEMPGQPKGAMSGIYKLEGDRLTIASHARSEKLIPVGFEPDAEHGISVIVYERAKGDSPPASTRSGDVPRIPDTGPGTARPEPRDLQKEVDQLREQLKRLEKELKDRNDQEIWFWLATMR